MNRRFRIGSDEGQGLVEYALIIAIVSLGAVVALGFLSGKINSLFSKAGNSVNNVTVAAGGPGGGPGGPTTPPAYVSGASISCSVVSGGDCQDEGTMTINPGTWSGDTPISFTYQWYYNESGSAAGACNLPGGAGWLSSGGPGGWSGGTSATQNPLPDIPDGNGTDSMGVRVTASNGAPGSPVSANFCMNFEN